MKRFTVSFLSLYYLVDDVPSITLNIPAISIFIFEQIFKLIKI